MILAAASMLAIGACGDSSGGGEEDGNGAGSGAGMSSSAGMSGSSGSGGDSGSNGGGSGSGGDSGSNGGGSGSGSSSGNTVFSGYECNDAASGTCDDVLCALESGYNSITESCAMADIPICDAIAQCISDLADCFEPTCPSGDAAPSTDALNCIATYSTCMLGNIGTGT